MHKQKRKETLTALSAQIMVSDAITDQEKTKNVLFIVSERLLGIYINNP